MATKRPIGFGAWECSDKKNEVKSEKIEEISLEKQLDEASANYENMFDDVINEVSHGYKSYLTEKKLRLALEMDILELKHENERLKQEIFELKSVKTEKNSEKSRKIAEKS